MGPLYARPNRFCHRFFDRQVEKVKKNKSTTVFYPFLMLSLRKLYISLLDVVVELL